MKKITQEEELIFEFIMDFLAGDPEYALLTDDEKDKTYGIYRTILSSVYRSNFGENIYPIIYVKDSHSKHLIQESINKLVYIVPSVQRITVQIVH